MTLRRFASPPTPAARTGAVLALLALAGVAIATANTEAVVASRFAAALEAAPQDRTARGTDPKTLVSGSEAYWLAEKRRHESDGAAIEPAAWTAPRAAGLAVGDRIAVPGGKAERVLEVIAIADVEPAPGATPVGTAPAGPQIAVTCRDLSTPDGRLVTFLVPAAGTLAAAKPAHDL